MRASVVFIDTNITIKAREILIKMSILNSHPGNGITNITMIKITPMSTEKSLAFIVKPLLQT